MSRVSVRVMPNARKDEIISGEDGITVRTTAPPDKGKANRAVMKMLSKHFGARVRLVAGEKSRNKVFEVEDVVDDSGRGGRRCLA